MSAWEGRKPIGGVRRPIGKKPLTEGCSKHHKEPYPTWLRKPIPMTSKANQTADAKLISELREQIKNKDGQYQKLHSLFLTVHSDYQELGKTHLAMLGGRIEKGRG